MLAPTDEPGRKIVGLAEVPSLISMAIEKAGRTLQELSKDKPKSADQYVKDFVLSVETIEGSLDYHLNQLLMISTGQSHCGSTYAASKVKELAEERQSYVREQLNSLTSPKNVQLPPSLES